MRLKIIGGIRMMLQRRMQLHTCSTEGPSQMLRKKVLEAKKARKMRKDPKRNEFTVTVPESSAYLDTLTLPMALTAVAIALFAKVLMMVDESKEQELLERKIQNAPEGQGTVRMLTREEWDAIQEIRPRTPFESKLARPNARLRTGEPLRWDDVKDWTVDVLADALTRAEDVAKSRTK